MTKALRAIWNVFVYLIGLLIIAVGINVSKRSALGISPVSSIPAVLSSILNVSLGSMVILVYVALVLAQLLVLRRRFQWKNALGVPVALIFGMMVDFVGVSSFKLTLAGIPLGIETEFHGLMEFLPKPDGLLWQFVYLLASILIIGIGVFIYLRPKLVPMPAEGLAGAISQVGKWKFGNCKTAVDFSLILIAAILQVILLGGFGTLWIGGAGPVGVGTVLAAVCVGQVVKLLNKAFK
ncbi:MAG: hypothetical protein J6X61_06280 [Clostridia bacterium]|nr:hypothetical protein [Clostridia bacterium]